MLYCTDRGARILLVALGARISRVPAEEVVCGAGRPATKGPFAVVPVDLRAGPLVPSPPEVGVWAKRGAVVDTAVAEAFRAGASASWVLLHAAMVDTAAATRIAPPKRRRVGAMDVRRQDRGRPGATRRHSVSSPLRAAGS